jgi:hypothetical protein
MRDKLLFIFTVAIACMTFNITVFSVTPHGINTMLAGDSAETIILQIGSPIMTVDGVEQSIDENGTAPLIQNGRTLLPVRAVVEAMGGTVEWHGETETVILICGTDTINLAIGNNIAQFNGNDETLDTAPLIINGRTMLPIRFIAQSFGFDVQWNEVDSIVTLTAVSEVIPNDGNIAQGNILYLRIGSTTLTATLVENTATQALRDLLAVNPITINMRDFGGFEKVGSLGTTLPRNDERTTTQSGDLVLFQGNQLVMFYASNTWSYTRLGRINDVSQAELRNILGSGDVTVTLSLN